MEELKRRTLPERPGGELLAPGTMIEHFRVMRLVGRGGMGEVYLVRDTRLGRRAALKIVSAAQVATPGAREAFQREAETTARFSHPNIVQLHAVGEHEGRPWVALEYLEGQNLALRVKERRPGLTEAVRIALAIAEALAEAHRHGVLHMDLKPSNVVIPADGRPRVVDFGLAITTESALPLADGTRESPAEPAERRHWGTPAYAPPERWRGEPATAATDVWALGVIVFELVTGRLPFDGATMIAGREAICGPTPAPRLDAIAEVPEALAAIVARCLDKDPLGRPPASEVQAELQRVVGDRLTLAGTDAGPFRGLLPFDQRHAHLFFGRDAEVTAFVERLRRRPVLAVVGPAGSGKTSLVQAGVIPRLREQDAWLVLQLRPGTHPFVTLADRLRRRETQTYTRSGEIVSDARRATESTTDRARAVRRSGEISGPREAIVSSGGSGHVADDLFENPRGLALALRQIAEAEQCGVLLVVDQLEELFTVVDDPVVRSRFMQAICTAADDVLEPVRVIFTVRDDYLGRLSLGPEAREALAHVIVVQSLGGDALEEVLRRPVEAVGYRWEDPGIVTEMAQAVAGHPGGLPLLQFAGQSLWERRDEARRMLLRSAYARIGGVEGALARHADGVLADLEPEEKTIARELLLRLVTPERTRRVVALSTIRDALPVHAGPVIARLMESRLISVTRAATTGGAELRLELAHESLIRKWETLSRWLDASREELAFLADATLAAELWEKRGRRVEELWQDDALHDAERMLARIATDLPDAVDRFLGACHRKQNRREQKRRFVFGSIAAALVLVTGFAIAVALFVADKEREARRERNEAQLQREEAQRQAAQAREQRAVALREGARAALGNGRVLEARAKLRMALEHGDGATARALWWSLGTNPALWTADIGTFGVAVAVSPDGATVASGCQDAAVCLLDMHTRAVRVLRGHRQKVSAIAWSHDGARLVTGDWGESILVWDPASGRIERKLEGHADRVLALELSPDDAILASAGRDRTIRLWDASTGETRAVLEGHEGGIEGLAFAPDGRTLASGAEDRTVRRWDVATGRLLDVLEGHDAAVEDVAYGPRGQNLASAGNEGTIRIWDAKTGELVRVLEGHEGGVRGLSFSADGHRLASGAYDNTVRVWNVASGEAERTFVGHGASVRDVAFAPDGRRLVSTSYDETVRVWNVDVQQSPAIEEGHAGAVRGVDLSPDGSLVASGGFDRTVRLWDSASGEPVAVLRGHESAVYGVAFSPDGTRLASAGAEGQVRLWDVASRKTERVLSDDGAATYAVAFSPDGTRLASGSRDRTVRLWDVESGTLTRTLDGLEHIVWDVRFDRTGRRVAAASWDRSAAVWDAATGTLRHRFAAHEGALYGVDFDPEHPRLATSGADGTIRAWDLGSGKPETLATLAARTHVVRFSPDGNRIAAAVSDGSVHVWTVGDGNDTVLAAHADEATVVQWSRDGSRLASVGDDGTVRLWEMPSARPHWRAPALLREPLRLLSHRGWVAIDGTAGAMPDTAWRRALEAEARLVDEAEDGSTLCVQTHAGRVNLWDRQRDALEVDAAQPGVRRVVARPGACIVHADDGVTLVAPGGVRSLVRASVEAIGVGAGAILVAADERVRAFDEAGNASEDLAVGVGVTAVARSEHHIVVGYRDGTIAAFPAAPHVPAPPESFERPPSGAVTRLVVGPMNTVVAGYATGALAMWSLDDGTRLADARLHGPIVHLVLHQQRLHAATDLGRTLTWDLGVFFRTDCGVLREVWAQVPVVWEDGRAVQRDPPADHRCR